VIAGVVAIIALAARRDGDRGFAFATELPRRTRHEPDAHPVDGT
jgi:hypothetical protein